jgi:hypothetical protein
MVKQAPRSEWIEGRQAMQAPEGVQAMLKLASLGWGAKRISGELGCSRNTVLSYLRQGGWRPYQSPQRPGRLTAHRDWLAERFCQHRGNCDVVRQELQREHGIAVSLRTVERAVAHLRREVLAQTAATVRFETPPGHQLQIDFGTVRVLVGDDEPTKVHLFVANVRGQGCCRVSGSHAYAAHLLCVPTGRRPRRWSTREPASRVAHCGPRSSLSGGRTLCL